MRIGNLRNRIEIYEAVVSYDRYHSPINTYTLFTTVWAEIKSQRGDEINARVYAEDSIVPMKITIRYVEGILPTMYVKDLVTGTIYNINAIRDPNGKREILEMDCSYSFNENLNSTI